MNITAIAIAKSRVTLVALFLFLFGGYQAYQGLSRAEDPWFPIRAATVVTQFPGAGPKRVEELVSDKIEKKIQEIPELKDVTSNNQTGLSVVTANFRDSVKPGDLQAVFDKMRRKVDAARGELPDGAKDPVVNDEFGDVFGTVIGLTGDGFDYRELKVVADQLRDQLLQVPDVAKVEIYGEQPERVFVEFQNERLSKLGLSPAQLQGRAGSAKHPHLWRARAHRPRAIRSRTDGQFSHGPRHRASPHSASQRRCASVVRSRDGHPKLPRSASSALPHTGTPGLALAVAMRDGGNLVSMGDGVLKTVKTFTATQPIGIELAPVIFQPADVDAKVDDFINNLLQAIGVVMLAMILFLGLRTGLVGFSAHSDAMASALLFMQLFGIGLDQVSLAALIIALGMLVDNAVVVAESIQVQMRQGEGSVAAAVKSAGELTTPLLVASLTTAAAFLPIYLAESTVGEYTAPLFKVVTITLLCSWVLSITATPAALPPDDESQTRRGRGVFIAVLSRLPQGASRRLAATCTDTGRRHRALCARHGRHGQGSSALLPALRQPVFHHRA